MLRVVHVITAMIAANIAFADGRKPSTNDQKPTTKLSESTRKENSATPKSINAVYQRKTAEQANVTEVAFRKK